MAEHRTPNLSMSHQAGDSELFDLDTLNGNASPPQRSSSAHGRQVDKANDAKRTITGFRWLLVCLATFSANLLYGRRLICLLGTKRLYDNTSQGLIRL